MKFDNNNNNNNNNKEAPLLTLLIFVFAIVFTQNKNNIFAEATTPDVSAFSNCVLWNAALNKPTDISGVYRVGQSENAVDGNRNPEFYGNSCIHTNFPSSESWWLVDLEEEFLVHRIAITNRDQNQHRIEGTTVDLFLADPREDESFPLPTTGTLCTEISTQFDGTKSFDCASPTYARYVLVYRKVANQMNFCEFDALVSKRKADSTCERVTSMSKLFDISRDTTLTNGQVLDTLTTRSHQACLLTCVGRGYACNACQWSQGTGQCQVFHIDANTNAVLELKAGYVYFVQAI